MVENIGRRGILRGADGINIWSEGGIDINGNGLPGPKNFSVEFKQAQKRVYLSISLTTMVCDTGGWISAGT